MDEVLRFSPRAAAALLLRGLVMRDERAGVAWSDMVLWFLLLSRIVRGRPREYQSGSGFISSGGAMAAEERACLRRDQSRVAIWCEAVLGHVI